MSIGPNIDVKIDYLAVQLIHLCLSVLVM